MDADPGDPKIYGSGSATLIKITLKQCCGSRSKLEKGADPQQCSSERCSNFFNSERSFPN
jgi:hypothetical protein